MKKIHTYAIIAIVLFMAPRCLSINHTWLARFLHCKKNTSNTATSKPSWRVNWWYNLLQAKKHNSIERQKINKDVQQAIKIMKKTH